MSASNPTIAVLVTMNTKGREARFIAEVLARAGATPWIVDLSLKSHSVDGADVGGAAVATAAGASWQALSERSRQDAATVMAEGGKKILLDRFIDGEISGVIGLGGANGTGLVCSIMRALPYLVPKIMVSTVAGTAAAQWYVAESDVAMYPSIGDVALNRITRSVMENAALAVAAAARNWTTKREAITEHSPLVAVSSFGGTTGCVDRVSERLENLGYEVIQFHASGVGGKSLERLAASGELAGVVDVTTHELTDLIVDGVYSAGGARLTRAGEAGLPQVIVPGAIDHANLWVGQVPERYQAREFFQYNAQNLLMRTNAEEFQKLGREFAVRINAAKGPVRVLVPLEGFSEHTKRRAHDLQGHDMGPWKRPEDYQIFVNTLKSHLKSVRVEELPLHVNDTAFADACVGAFLEIAREVTLPRRSR
ncbi:MAG TPA: Tm-1-like ATP-binding domain-containing protein [Xanthobacteraceae bacterium]|nr:Tm-1-like ATP-binding domain-containing protein [Xanthobacteraceae bacterium]